MLSGPENFIEEFQIPGRAEIDPDRFAQVTGVQVSELIELSRDGEGAEPVADIRQQVLQDSIRAISAAYSVAQDRDRALQWFRAATIPEFRNKSVKALVANGKIDALIRYLSVLNSGASG
jgi:hypothetical protein